MMNPLAKFAARMKKPAKDGLTLARLEFELALGIGDPDRPLAEVARQAAAGAGGDLLFVLPSTNGSGDTAMVRFAENGGSRFVQIRKDADGYVLSEDTEIETHLLGFARASLDVFQQLKADKRVLAPLTSSH
jgi:hypothetical protein